MKKEKKMFVVCLLLCMLISSVSYGQTTIVKRQKNNVSQNSPATKGKTGKQNTIKPIEQEKGIYYLCLNWGYNLGWTQQVCREMRTKGYPAIVIKDGSGYMTCVSTFKDRESANAFYKSFSDKRYNITGVKYNGYNVEGGMTKTSSQLYELAEDYYYGRNGKSKDKYDANQWYFQAAYIDNALAQLKLGILYENGEGGTFHNERNLNIAAIWYKKAANQGNAEAQYNLGRFYEYGYGLDKDIDEAKRWYKKALANGNTSAKSALERLRAGER